MEEEIKDEIEQQKPIICNECEYLGKRDSKVIHPDVNDTSIEFYCKKSKLKIRGYVKWYKNKNIFAPPGLCPKQIIE